MPGIEFYEEAERAFRKLADKEPLWPVGEHAKYRRLADEAADMALMLTRMQAARKLLDPSATTPNTPFGI